MNLLQRKPPPRARLSRGQSMVEYLVAVSIVITMFAIPFDANGPLILQISNAVGTGFARLLGSLSLPL
jgi:hypothetical protein